MSKHVAPEIRRQSLADSFVPLRLQWAVAEASRCLMCDDPPCQKGCLAGVDIKKFIRALRSRNLRLATSVIREANFLVASCGRVCPQAQLCEGRCSASGLARPIAIGELQRFVGENAIREKQSHGFPAPRSQGEVAVVGGGPAGLAAAYYLRRQGVVADLYERRPQLGGIPMAGIPAFRLPRELLRAELAFVETAGIRVHHQELGDLRPLLEQYRAVFLACGLGAARRTGLPGEALEGVSVADQLLERVNLEADRPASADATVVLGGGNTAFDAASLSLAPRLLEGAGRLSPRRGRDALLARAPRPGARGGRRAALAAVPVEILGDQAGQVRAFACSGPSSASPARTAAAPGAGAGRLRARRVPAGGAGPRQCAALALANARARARRARRTAGRPGDARDLAAGRLRGRRFGARRGDRGAGRGRRPPCRSGHGATACCPWLTDLVDTERGIDVHARG